MDVFTISLREIIQSLHIQALCSNRELTLLGKYGNYKQNKALDAISVYHGTNSTVQ